MAPEVHESVIEIRAGDLRDPSAVYSGTGFFYVARTDDGFPIPMIMSSKSVLCDKAWLEFDFTLADEAGERIPGPAFVVHVDAGRLPILGHSNPSIDLAAVGIVGIIDQAASVGKNLHAAYLSNSCFPQELVQGHLGDYVEGRLFDEVGELFKQAHRRSMIRVVHG